MTGSTAYNGLRAKQVNQVNRQDGSPCAAFSAPDFFVSGQSIFAPKRSGNQVRFFTTGEDYFKDVAAAIDQAQTSIYITGWQINYDVLLDGRRTLWQCLHQALNRRAELKVYVMPWLSPAASVGTYDFETMLAIFQLNAGLAGNPRAFCTPAIQQSDMRGLGATFSHHQKSVVIDNRIGYVGGIDLAYGRRDDNNFSLNAADRIGNDAYNPSIPKFGWMPLHKHVSKNGLIMAALFDLSRPALPSPLPGMVPSRGELANSVNYLLNVLNSPTPEFLQTLKQPFEAVGEALEQGRRSLVEFKMAMLERSVRTIAELIQLDLDMFQLPTDLQQRLQPWLQQLQQGTRRLSRALELQSIHLITEWMSRSDLGQLFSKLLDLNFDDIPVHAMEPISELSSSALWYLFGLLQRQTLSNQGPFPYLLDHPQPLSSADNTRLAADQPRMPWQDVHSRIEGPSVYDLSRNFVDRWNGQQAYLTTTPPPQDSVVIRRLLEALMTWVNRLLRSANLHHFLDARSFIRLDLQMPAPVWIQARAELPGYPQTRPGGVSVQVLRSAASNMLRQEQNGRRTAGVTLQALPGFESTGIQTDCKSAMLQAISSAQQFIYIENQFFQSMYGSDGELNPLLPLSGPMARLRTADHLPRELVERVNLRVALATKNIWALDWAEIDAIARNPNPVREAFLKEMRSILGGNVQGWLTGRMGPEQTGIINNIGQALADRIGRAIDEKRPFHVYMILPVHPEGALNVPNIMHQIHLTMQSLVFGQHSLIKRIQRRMAMRAFMDRGASRAEAAQIAERVDNQGRPIFEEQDWTRYLTLLNLRTWDELDGKVVTEQIYVHSKLLIADDRVAILGSANINDRSLLGPRDSELAVVIRDSAPVSVALDGKCHQQVSKAVHELRVALWKKHFGMSQTRRSKVHPAEELESCLTQPAAESSWKAIQRLAKENSEAYEQAFAYIPQNNSQTQPIATPSEMDRYPDGFPASVWPTWAYSDLDDLSRGGSLVAPMPYEERFWRPGRSESTIGNLPPAGVQGFICQLPIRWTRGENNDSGINTTVLADLSPADRSHSTQPELASRQSKDNQDSHTS